MPKPTIVFCDFDGTITTKDSLAEFIKYYKSPLQFYWGLIILSPILILFKIGLISNQKAKEALTKYFFRGESCKEFEKISSSYSLNEIDKIIIPTAISTLHAHKRNGSTIVIVSASFKLYLKDWCEKKGFELLATELEVINEKITGNLIGKNCYGIEKVDRIQKTYCIKNFEIYAYGDSKGDLPMLNIANKSFYRMFSPK